MIANDFQDNYGNGWIKLYRSVKSHWILPKKTPRTNFEAWIIILLEVNHSGQKIQIGYDILECGRGESLNSLDTWAKIFNWHKSKVRRFLKMLESDSMIVLKKCEKTTHLKVCNYETYQGERNTSETEVKRKRNGSETEVTPNNNDKNDNNIFEDFWNSYHLVTGLRKTDKEKSNKYFNRLTKSEQKKAIESIRPYFESLNDKKFCKKARTYISSKAFNDEFKLNGNHQPTKIYRQ
jgi:hypothetical protein